MLREHTVTEHIVKYSQDGVTETEEIIAVEHPLTVTFNGEELATIVCTPSDLEDLVTGFLAAEGIIRFPEEIRSLAIDERGGFAHVETKVKQPPSNYATKRFVGSCCGKSRHFYFQNDAKTAKTITTCLQIRARDCFRIMRLLQEKSASFQVTGGVHNAALCSKSAMTVLRTDIGRHNALDKIYGYCLRRRIPVGDKLIVFSGRVSSEVLLKIAKIGVGILLSKSAPTDLALELAEDLNVTVVGFIRGSSFNVYTHPERITDLTGKGGIAQHGKSRNFTYN